MSTLRSQRRVDRSKRLKKLAAERRNFLWDTMSARASVTELLKVCSYRAFSRPVSFSVTTELFRGHRAFSWAIELFRGPSRLCSHRRSDGLLHYRTSAVTLYGLMTIWREKFHQGGEMAVSGEKMHTNQMRVTSRGFWSVTPKAPKAQKLVSSAYIVTL